MASANGHIKILEELMNLLKDKENKVEIISHRNADGNTPLRKFII